MKTCEKPEKPAAPRSASETRQTELQLETTTRALRICSAFGAPKTPLAESKTQHGRISCFVLARGDRGSLTRRRSPRPSPPCISPEHSRSAGRGDWPEGAQRRSRASGCSRRIASAAETRVYVLPVPGGPNRTRGRSPLVRARAAAAPGNTGFIHEEKGFSTRKRIHARGNALKTAHLDLRGA